MVTTQARAGTGAGAGDRGIQGEADGVKDARLAGAGGAMDQEKTRGGEGVEIDSF